jgi:hypothetical protein
MTSIVTFKGAVTVASVNAQGHIVGTPVLVKKGEMTTTTPGAAPEPPKAIPKEEVKKMDIETASVGNSPSKEGGPGNREVASEAGLVPPAKEMAPPMIDKKDLDAGMAKDIKDVRSTPQRWMGIRQ